MTGHEIYVRYTSESGATHAMEHRVWDAARFMAARKADAESANEKARKDAKNPGAFIPLAKVEQIARQQYINR
jgi:hypothetical protein